MNYYKNGNMRPCIKYPVKANDISVMCVGREARDPDFPGLSVEVTEDGMNVNAALAVAGAFNKGDKYEFELWFPTEREIDAVLGVKGITVALDDSGCVASCVAWNNPVAFKGVKEKCMAQHEWCVRHMG